MIRVTLAAALGILGSSSALAGGFGCGGADCYRHVVSPPVYGAVAEPVMVRPPHHYTAITPGEFTVVSERVLVAPPGRVWQVSRDAYGNTVGCWVTTPARYAVRHRQVMVRPPQLVRHYQPAQYAVQHRRVLVQPARSGWEPIGGGYARPSYAGGYADAGFGPVGGPVGGLVGSAAGLGLDAASAGLGFGADLAGGVVGGVAAGLSGF